MSGYDTQQGRYVPFIHFVSIEFYEKLENYWPDHYIGMTFNGEYYELPAREEVKSKGPMI